MLGDKGMGGLDLGEVRHGGGLQGVKSLIFWVKNVVLRGFLQKKPGWVWRRGPSRLRLSEFVQISEFFSIYITDICQTSESFAKSVNLKKERAERTIPSVEATGILR